MRNPVALARQIDDRAPENRVLGNVTGTLMLHADGLTATDDDRRRLHRAPSDRRTSRAATRSARSSDGLARQAERSLQNINFQQLLTCDAEARRATHELEVVGGYEFSRFDNIGFEAIAQGFITDAFQFNNLGAGTQTGSPPPVSYMQREPLVSFFSRANYGYAGKYFLTGVLRCDGSSRLAEGNKWSTFPAISGSWRLSEEASCRTGRSRRSRCARGGGGRATRRSSRTRTQLLLKTEPGASYPFGTTRHDRPRRVRRSRTRTSSGRRRSRPTSVSTAGSRTTASPA